MKTVRIQYSTKADRNIDQGKWFSGLNSKDPNAVNNHHARFVSETLVDMLVPDNFDPSGILGTVVKPDHNSFPHIFMGHDATKAIVDKIGTIEDPTPIKPESPPEETPE